MTSKKDIIRRLKSDRTQLVAQLNRFNQFITNCDDSANKITVNERFVRCESLWDNFDKIQLELEFLDEAHEPENSEQRNNFEEMYFETICLFKEKLQSRSLSDSNIVSSELSQRNVNSNVVKLPPLDLPSFEGCYDQWTNFFDSFMALIHSNTSLTNVQKFYYLQSCLKGEAAHAISSIQVTDLNYENAFKLLRERYENKRLIIQSHLRLLFELAQINKSNHIELRCFLDTIQKNVRALKSLGEPVEHWDTLLVYMFTLKLDLNTRKDWESYNIKNNSHKYTDFIAFLNEKCQILESVESNSKNLSNLHLNKGTSSNTQRPGPPNKRFSSNSYFGRNQCSFCQNHGHWISECTKFLQLPVKDRINEIKRLHLCLNCFLSNHLSIKCTSKRCSKCDKPHNVLLHLNFKNTENNVSNNSCKVNFSENSDSQNEDTAVVSSANQSIIAHSFDHHNNEILLSTAKVLVFDKYGKMHEARALLDCGSQSNFVRKELVQSLGLKVDHINMSIVGISGSVSNSTLSVTIKFKSKHNEVSEKLKFIILDQITNHLPTFPINKSELKLPCNIHMADDSFDTPGPIDLLIGAEIFYDLLLAGQIRIAEGMPILQKTKLGWIVSGSIRTNNHPSTLNNSSNNNFNQTICNLTSNSNIQRQIEKFWIMEEVPSIKIWKREEIECEEFFKSSLQKAENGQYIVALPVRDGIKELGDSKQIALKRFGKLERKLSTDSKLRTEYIKFMTEYEDLGHMSPIPECEIKSSNPQFYLPHHPVFKESSSTTKVRVVFDASAKTNNGISLNDKLKCGPVLQDDLLSILIRFRQHYCVIGADVEKMYRRVLVSEQQRDLQRIIWRKSPDEELTHYRLNTVTYGMTSASYLAIRCLIEAANEESQTFPEACRVIKRDFYVDDLLSGAPSISEAIQLKNEIAHILQKRGFLLRQWVSNKAEVLKDQPYSAKIKHYVVEEAVSKALGVVWNSREDSLEYTVNLEKHHKVTKRIILSLTSKLFDPLGLIGPVIIHAKIIMQRLWSEHLSWDDPVSSDLNKLWCNFCEKLPILNQYSIVRHVFCDNPVVIELHGFCDSSELAYGACIYARTIDTDGSIVSNLVCAKSRVAPIKSLTLPRLELCGAVLLSRLMKKTMESLTMPINKFYYWTDSKIVLSWIIEEPATWNVFVSHRVSEIQQSTNIIEWRHVRSEENPSDLISRGCTPDKLICSVLWWHGPSWLTVNSHDWSPNTFTEADFNNLPEKRANRKIFTTFTNNNIDIFNKFSTFSKLQRVMCYILRFFKNITTNKNNKSLECLTVIELNDALIYLVKLAQGCVFNEEIHDLTLKRNISSKSKLLPLSPFLDSNGVLRVGGRLKKSNISYDQKHPIILDKNHILSKLLIVHYHRQNLHMGPQGLLCCIRDKFWILGGINTIKRELRSCIICFRMKPKPLEVLMGDLPEARLTPKRPFFNCGLDYAGPFNIKSSKIRNSKILKSYLCLFVCFATKAVHLEIVSDLTTEAFLNALKRFIARRGKCQNIFSDCASNFVGANREIKDLYKLISDKETNVKLKDYLCHEGINWNFIPARSPHFGGLWESHIKIAKEYMKKVVGNSSLTFEELSTVFTQIEACMNSRPLSPLSNDPKDLMPLTPGHFLIGEPLLSLVEPNVRDVKCSHLKRYQHLSQLVQTFWNRWSHEYLNTLNRRSKWQVNNDNFVKIGDLVILREDNLPPLKWNLGRVIEVFPGSDGLVRVVSVQTAKGIFKRAVAKISVLPIE